MALLRAGGTDDVEFIGPHVDNHERTALATVLLYLADTDEVRENPFPTRRSGG